MGAGRFNRLDYVERSVACGKVEINYASWPGDGPPLLLIHGLSSRWQTWLNVLPLLQPRWRLTAIDLRGHGKSGRPAEGYPLAGYAADVEAFIGQVFRGPIRVVGHSLGAMTTMVVASSAPHLVLAAVLEDPPIYAYCRPEGAKRFALTHEMASLRLPVEKIAERILRERPETPVEQALASAENWRMLDPRTVGGVVDGSRMWDDAIEGAMRGVTCPTLLLQGNPELGGALYDAESDRAASLMKCCTIVRWPETGHGMHQTRPADFVAAVDRHFKGA
jgi:pimeloyl-ACP methyl ester carboxylesterase